MDFKCGDRIRLVSMYDKYEGFKSGQTGTVLSVAPKPVNVLNVEWDEDFFLNPCLDVDVVKKIDE